MSQDKNTIPQKIGKYEIASKIGEGGFGVVYKGRDPFLKRTVAVKTCNSDQEVIRKRFFREAEIAGKLRHDNIVTVHDFGVHEETPFLVQEFLTGEDLDVLIKSGYDALDMAFKTRCLREVAEGLAYAHQQGVIHRDIKPANIRVLQSGRIKVMDFGIAKLEDQQTQLTKTGMTLGTVSYLSPEQLRGDEADHRVDIFSYGVLAYELLSAKKPFSAKSISNLFFKLLHEEAPALRVEDLPPGMGALVKRCLEKDPDARYQAFDDAITELHEIQVASGFSADDASFPGRGVPDVVSTVREALRAGELTAAEFSLDLARKQMGNSDEFDRRFGGLQRQLAELKEGGEYHSSTTETSGPTMVADITEVRRRIADGEYQIAESKLIALSKGRRGDPEVEGLWNDLRQARTGKAGELPLHGEQTVGGAWWQSRQNQLLTLGVVAAIALLMMIVWFAARGSSSASTPEPATEAPVAAAGQTEPIPAEAPAPALAETVSVSEPDPAAAESLILEPAEPAGSRSDVTNEEWVGEVVEGKANDPPPEEFPGGGQP